MKKRLVALTLGMTALFAMSVFAEDTFKIGFSTRCLTNEPFQACVLEAVESAVKESGNEVVTFTTDNGSDAAQQVTQLEDLVNMDCDAIIYVPIDGTSSIEMLKTCKEKGITVVLIDGELEPGYEDLYVTLVATNNYQAGYEAGKALVESGVTEGKAIACRGPEGVLACDRRVDGFIDAVSELSDIEVVADRYTDGNNESTMDTVQQMLAACPDPVAFYCAADCWVEGGILALEEAGIADSVKVCTCDGSETGIGLLEEGRILVDTQQNPRVMGSKSVEIVLSILNGETTAEDYESYIDSGVTVVTEENLDEGKENMF